MTIKTTALAISACLAFATGTNAVAARSHSIDHVSVKVAFYDLDPETAAGAKSLYTRLQRASRRACGLRRTKTLRETSDARRCYRQSLDAAVDRVDSEKLQLLHRAS